MKDKRTSPMQGYDKEEREDKRTIRRRIKEQESTRTRKQGDKKIKGQEDEITREARGQGGKNYKHEDKMNDVQEHRETDNKIINEQEKKGKR